MKYTNILAGVFGLMALAACSNNDEVTVEQPKEVHTITVAYGRGANTRLTIDETYNGWKLYFKTAWESTDQIKLVAEDGKTVYEYSIETINDDGTATFTREGKPADGTYKVVYPASWDGSLSDYNFQNKTSIGSSYDDYLFDIKDYQQAMAIAECKDGKFEEIALKPIFNFLYIPAGLKIRNMETYDWSTIGGGCTKEIDGKTIFDTSIELKGTNLYKTIKNYAGENTGSLWIRSNGKYESWPVYYDSESKKWQFEYGTIVAFPVLPDQEPVTDLQLWFYEIPCYLLDASSSNKTEFSEGGHVYNLEDFNLFFEEGEGTTSTLSGKVIGANGKFYASVAEAEKDGTTGQAIVSHSIAGDWIAIALEDASPNAVSWENALKALEAWKENPDHAITGIEGGNWADFYPPAISDWKEAFRTLGGSESTSNDDFDYGKFREILTNVGGTDVQDGIYWSFKNLSPYQAYDFGNKKFVQLTEESVAYVRAYYYFPDTSE